jgi:hypothetical protein
MMAVDPAGITMDEGACRRRYRRTTPGRRHPTTTNRRHHRQRATSNRHRINASTTRHPRNAGRSCGLIKTTMRDIRRPILLLKRRSGKRTKTCRNGSE